MDYLNLDGVPAFKAWLKKQPGASIVAPTSEWEVLRWRVAVHGHQPHIAIIYKNKKGRLSFVGRAQDCIDAYLAGEQLLLTMARRAPEIPQDRAERGRRVTLYTDASHRNPTKSGAWAAVLLIGRRTFEASGPLKGEVKSSTSAEARAVANGLHHFLREDLILPGDQVTVVCDNAPVVSRLNGSTPRGKEDIKEPIERVRALASDHDLVVTGFWIKGHQPLGTNAHVKHNRRADRLCGRHGLELHKERKAGPKIEERAAP